MTRLVHHSCARYHGTAEISNDELETRAQDAINLYKEIIKGGDSVKKEESIYDAEVMPGITLCDIMYNSQIRRLSPDCLSNLRLMIDQSPPLTQLHLDEALLTGTVGLYSSTTPNSLASSGDWIHFVRTDLVKNQKPVDEFFSSFKLAFPRLKFSTEFPLCLTTFSGGHSQFTGIITRSLSSLNDDWVQDEKLDLPKTLRLFSSKSNCSTSLEGNGERKTALTFTFNADRDLSEHVLCEPHMKLEQSDSSGQFFYHRIYFCPRSHESFKDKILVGHVGRHL